MGIKKAHVWMLKLLVFSIVIINSWGCSSRSNPNDPRSELYKNEAPNIILNTIYSQAEALKPAIADTHYLALGATVRIEASITDDKQQFGSPEISWQLTRGTVPVSDLGEQKGQSYVFKTKQVGIYTVTGIATDNESKQSLDTVHIVSALYNPDSPDTIVPLRLTISLQSDTAPTLATIEVEGSWRHTAREYHWHVNRTMSFITDTASVTIPLTESGLNTIRVRVTDLQFHSVVLLDSVTIYSPPPYPIAAVKNLAVYPNPAIEGQPFYAKINADFSIQCPLKTTWIFNGDTLTTSLPIFEQRAPERGVYTLTAIVGDCSDTQMQMDMPVVVWPYKTVFGSTP